MAALQSGAAAAQRAWCDKTGPSCLQILGTFKAGNNAVFGVKQGGSGIGSISPKVPKAIVAKVLALQAQIKAGKIKNIPTVVK